MDENTSAITPAEEPAAETPKNPNKKLLVIIAGAVVVVLVAVIVLVVVLRPNAQNDFFRAIDNGQAQDAIAIFNEHVSGDSSAVAAVNETAVQRMESIRDSFFNGRQSYEDTIAALENFADIDVGTIAETLEAVLKEVGILHTSNLAFQRAGELEKADEIAEALAEYANVIEDDANFENAQARISALAGQSLEQAQALYDEQDFRGALELARTISAALGEEANEELAAQANDMANQTRTAWLEELESKVQIETDEFTGDITVNPIVHSISTFERTSRSTGFDTVFPVYPSDNPPTILFLAFIHSERAFWPSSLIVQNGSLQLEMNFTTDLTPSVHRETRLIQSVAIVELLADEVNILSEMEKGEEEIRIRFRGREGNTMDVTIAKRGK